MKWYVLVGLWICLLPSAAHAASSAGFVEGIWYSTTTPVAHVPVRIYVAVRNNSGSDITGTITFYDNGHSIDSAQVAAVDGHIIESWTDWTPTAGSHTISAKLMKVEAHAIGKAPTPTIIANANATSTITVKTPPPPPPTTDVMSHIDTNMNPPHTTASSDTTPTALPTAAGLEQYLPPSVVTRALGAVTDLTNHAKQAVDTYRTNRTLASRPLVGTTTLDIPVDASGFGTITRSTAAPRAKAEVPHDTFGSILRTIGHIFAGLVTAILALTSWTLSYPALVQILLLLLILFALYQGARRAGKRRFRK